MSMQHLKEELFYKLYICINAPVSVRMALFTFFINAKQVIISFIYNM